MLSDSNEVTNLQFEARVNRVIPASARTTAFYAKVSAAGHSHSDPAHAAGIEKCKTFEVLRLETKSVNPYASNAVAVFSQAGDQIGYLDSQLAHDLKGNDARWMVIFRHKNRHPATGAAVGATVY